MPPKPVLLYGAGAAPLLNASTRTLAPFTAGMPKLSAAWPDRKLTMPILNVSCACAPPAQKAAAAPASASAAGCQDRLREVCLVMPCLLWVGAGKNLRGGRSSAAGIFVRAEAASKDRLPGAADLQRGPTWARIAR